MDIVNEILKWPVIIQGALGSFLFWIVFSLGQRSFQLLIGKFNGDKELGKYFAECAIKSYLNKDYQESNINYLICIYAALHYFLKFVLTTLIIWLVSPFVPVFSYIGYVLAFYFLFRSLSYIPHFDSLKSLKEFGKNK